MDGEVAAVSIERGDPIAGDGLSLSGAGEIRVAFCVCDCEFNVMSANDLRRVLVTTSPFALSTSDSTSSSSDGRVVCVLSWSWIESDDILPCGRSVVAPKIRAPKAR